MRITQGTFSYLPDLTDEEIAKQVQYGLDNGWAPAVEFTDDPHPRNVLWEMWGLPMFELKDAAGVVHEVNECRKAYPNHYIRVSLSTPATAGRPRRSRSSSTDLPRSPASESTGRRARSAASATPCTPTPPSSRTATGTGTATARRRDQQQPGRAPGGRGAREFSMGPPTVPNISGEPDEPKLLGEDDRVDLEAELRSSNTMEILERLDRELVGLQPVKTRIRDIAALLLVDRLRNRYGLTSRRPTLHMSFTGSPGTGKTTVAMRMAELLHGLGYLRKGHLVSVTRDDLVGQYVGHTAPKTKEVLKRAMGGVLFIDEAYYLYREDNERDYGQETIEILLQMMENEREDLVVILAGYKDRMERFFQSNPGMGSRIAHHIDFPDYTLDELLAIADLMLSKENYESSPEAHAVFQKDRERRMSRPRFADTRSVRNALERARLRQASRLLSTRSQVGKADLVRLEPGDITRSRVFEEGEPETDTDEAPASAPSR